MIHRLDVGMLPDLGAPRVLRPSLDAAAQVEDVAVGPRGLYFRALGPEGPGVYLEAEPGRCARVLADGPGRARAPWPWSGGVMVRRGEAVHVIAEGRAPLEVPGDVFGIAPSEAVAVVLDRRARRLRRVDLQSQDVQDVFRIDGVLDRQVPPVLSLDRTGARAVLMDGRAEGQVHLLCVDLAAGHAESLLGPLPPRSWVTGAFSPARGEVVALEQRLGPQPKARLQRLGPRPRTLLELEAPQRMLRPVFLEEDVLVVPITEPGLGLVRRGPTALCVICSPGGARRAAVQMSRGQPRVLGGDLILEGGAEVLVFEGAARGLTG